MSAGLHAALVPGRRGWTAGPLAGVVRMRVLVGSLLLGTALVALLLVAVLTGTLDVPFARVLEVWTGGGERVDQLVVTKRTTRGLLAAGVGCALGVAGAITQSLTRNPLASPDVLGVAAGAGVAATAVIVTPLAAVCATAVPVAALAGGVAVTVLIVALAWRRGLDPMRLVLAGVGVTAVCGAITTWLLMRAELEDAAVATRWLTGSVIGATWSDVRTVGVALLVALVLLPPLAPALADLRLGDERARALGTDPARAQALLLTAAVVLVALATAVAGPVGFVAFAAPQVALRLLGTAGPPLVGGGLVGAVVVLGADLSTRWLPVELPVGVLTSILGAPVLLWLVSRYVRKVGA